MPVRACVYMRMPVCVFKCLGVGLGWISQTGAMCNARVKISAEFEAGDNLEKAVLSFIYYSYTPHFHLQSAFTLQSLI